MLSSSRALLLRHGIEQSVDELQRIPVFIEDASVPRLQQDRNDAPVVVEHEARHIRFRPPRHEALEKLVGLVGGSEARVQNGEIDANPQRDLHKEWLQ